MKKSNSTKKALLLSIVSLCLCIAMLAGTTFAWFTDSVSSENNIITAGNLDIELYWSATAEEGSWQKVGQDTNIFKDNTLWEPGHTEVVYLKVVNEGTLALKYQLGVNIAEEIEGVNQAGNPFKLSDYIKFGVDEIDQAISYGTRQEALAAVKDSMKIISAGYSKSSKLYPKNNVDNFATQEYVALVVTMPEDVNNDANHNGKNVPSIKLGLSLFATQCSYEDDSYGDDYDGNAWHPDMKVYSANDLKSALYNGETNIALMGDIDLDEELVLPDGIVMDMNGCTLSVQYLTGEGTMVISNGTLELPADGCVYTNGNQNITLENVVIDSDDLSVEAYTGGTIRMKNVTLKNTSLSNPVQNYGGTLILENVTVSQEGDANTAWYSSALQVINQIKWNEAAGRYQTVSQANTTVNGGTYTGKKALMISAPGGNVTINDGTFEGSEYAIQADFAPKNYLDGSNYESVITINGGTFKGGIKVSAAVKLEIKGGTFTVDPTPYLAAGYWAQKVGSNYVVLNGNTKMVATADELKDALTNGFNVILVANIGLNGTTVSVPANVTATLDLNGKTISSTALSSNTSMFNVANSAKLTIMDSVGTGKITYHSNNSSYNGYTVELQGELVLESGTLEKTGSWAVSYAVNVNANAWATAYTAPTAFTMNGGKIVCDGSAIRVVSFSNETYTNISTSFTMNGGTIEATGDGVFVQQPDGIWDVLNVTINGGTIKSTRNPIRIYAAVPTGYVNGEDCIKINLSSNATLMYTGDTVYNDWILSNKIRYGGGATVDQILNSTTITMDGYDFVSDGLYKDASGNYYVYNAAGLKALNEWFTTNAYAHAIWGKTYNIMADIDAKDITWSCVKLNVPNNDCEGFTFNGNGHIISNLTVSSAMFHSTANGKNTTVPTTFKNLTFDNAVVTGGYHTGIVWAQMYGDIVLENVHVIDSTITGTCNVGALIGRNGDGGESTVVYKGCSVTNTTITATGNGDPNGASVFQGSALTINDVASVTITFENCTQSGNTLNNADGQLGGGIYAWWNASTNETGVVNDFN